ncbi:MAG: hypothetical protein Kow0059_19490 [Candidatus Sumerlaeia bacterium]
MTVTTGLIQWRRAAAVTLGAAFFCAAGWAADPAVRDDATTAAAAASPTPLRSLAEVFNADRTLKLSEVFDGRPLDGAVAGQTTATASIRITDADLVSPTAPPAEQVPAPPAVETPQVATSEPTPERTEEPVIRIVFHNEDGTQDVVSGEPEQIAPSPPAQTGGEQSQTPTVPADLETGDTTHVYLNAPEHHNAEGLLYAEALKYLAGGQRRAAENSLRLLFERYPTSPLAPPALFELINLLDAPDEKISWCNYFITNYEQSTWAPHVYLIKGDALARVGALDEAITAYRMAAATLDDVRLQVEAVRRQVALLAGRGDYAGVLSALAAHPSPDLGHQDPETQFYHLQALLGRQQWAQAEELAEWMLDHFPDFPHRPQTLLARATLLEHSSQYQAARSLYEQVLSSYPQMPESELVAARLKGFSAPLWPEPATRAASF